MHRKLKHIYYVVKNSIVNFESKFYWEYYNRQTFVSEGIKSLGIDSPRVLDVGGATGDNLLIRFGIDDVTTLDIDDHANIVASATDIPLPDSSYDVVTCIDTLEHIPKMSREQVVSELIRVAKIAVFIVAPMDSPENNMAEKIVLKYRDCDFIADHQIHGLVDFNKIESHLEDLKDLNDIHTFEKHSLDNLHGWVIMMTKGFVDVSKIYRETLFLENRFCPKRIGLVIKKS